MADAPWGIVAGEGAQASEIEQKRALAKALLAQSMQGQNPTQTAGRYVVPFSPMQGLNQIGQGLRARSLNKEADQQQTAVTMQQKALAAALGKELGLDGAELAAFSSLPPDVGLKMVLSDRQRKDEQQRKDADAVGVLSPVQYQGLMGQELPEGAVAKGNLSRVTDYTPPPKKDDDFASWKRKEDYKNTHSQSGSDDTYSPDTVRTAAIVVMSDPNRMRDYASYGKSGQSLRHQINEEISKVKKETGMTDSDFIMARARARASLKSVDKMVPQLDSISAFENLAKANGQRALELFSSVDDTGIPIVEAVSRATKRQLGNVDAAELQSVLTAFQTEAARILSNPTMAGVVTDTARHEVQEMASGRMSVAQAKRVINRLFTEMDLRKQFLSDQIGSASGRTVVGAPQPQGEVYDDPDEEAAYQEYKRNNP